VTAARTAALSAALAAIVGTAHGASSVVAAHAHPAVHRASVASPAPTTAAGYQALWASLPSYQWGAADVSISVPLADGRDLWLYGDTFRGGGFVHSSAIVQSGGRLHVSAGGAQLLPNDSPSDIYWIEGAHRLPAGRVAVVAEPVHIGTAGPWDFHRSHAQDRVALVSVDWAGDVHFIAWTGWVAPPAPHTDFTVVGPHHYTYTRVAHPEVRLASGLTLYTVCQNWDDGLAAHVVGGVFRYQDFAPLFSEAAS
jgi:hypothetical protein